MGPLRLLHSFHKQKRPQSAPLLQRSSSMSVCVGLRLLLIDVARVVAVASHHLIARGAEGVALLQVRPLVAVDHAAADAVQRLTVLRSEGRRAGQEWAIPCSTRWCQS